MVMSSRSMDNTDCFQVLTLANVDRASKWSVSRRLASLPISPSHSAALLSLKRCLVERLCNEQSNICQVFIFTYSASSISSVYTHFVILSNKRSASYISCLCFIAIWGIQI